MNEQTITWRHDSFESLTTRRLFDILKLRQQVFVLEQSCLYPDIDDTDLLALHVTGWIGDDLALYARVIPPEVTYPQASIGRIVTAPAYRGLGWGRPLVQHSIAALEQTFGAQAIKIGAQSQLVDFYQSLGFAIVSEEYLEDGIPHIDMLRE